MAQTFFFYDLETSGFNPRQDRIMQFAGQRTTMDLQPIGEPYNLLVTLNDDTLPSPEALMVTGITPQKTVEEGYTEAQFARMVSEEVFTPGTIAVGFNNIRFDDEFIRHLLWRNFYDPYEWAWRDGRSRWDMLDVVRMMRALRPEGVNWPLDDKGEPTNRLELITALNKITHQNAHDALADVTALIEVTKLIKTVQPQLFDYLLAMRDKKALQQLVSLTDKKPFVYTSGRYDKAYDKTTVAYPLALAPHGNVLVYDLRYDPTPLVKLSQQQLAEKLFASWEERQAEGFIKLPVKPLQYNHCPAVAPLGVLEQGGGWQRIGLDQATVTRHYTILLQHPEFADRLRALFAQKPEYKKSTDPEGQLYEGFVTDADKARVEAVRRASAKELAGFHPQFGDERLPELLLHYKARSFPGSLDEGERAAWQQWRSAHVQAQLPQFMAALQRLATSDNADEFILQELQLWLESVLPTDE